MSDIVGSALLANDHECNSSLDVLGGFVTRHPRTPYVQLPDRIVSRIRYRIVLGAAGEADGLQTEWRISSRWALPDPTEHIRKGASRVVDFFAMIPQSILPLDDNARKILLGNQVVQSIRAQAHEENVALAALHGNAAGLQGVVAGLVAVLEYAAGGGELDAKGMLKVTTLHAQVAHRLVEVDIAIREAFRSECSLTAEIDEGQNITEPYEPVKGDWSPETFGPAASTQESCFSLVS